jgi:recombination protein RecT
LLLRDGPDGIEVLMTRRSPTASFAPGAYVFPGGGIDAADAAPTHATAAADRQGDLHLTQAIAAIRESFEELGVLLARHADGRMAGAATLPRWTASPFAAQCRARGLTLAADTVYVLAHWITDRDLPRRFDVPFLVARMPDRPAARGRRGRAVRARVGAPSRCAGAPRGRPVFHDLSDHPHAGAPAALCRRGCRAGRLRREKQPLWTSCPRAGCWAARKRATWSTRCPMASWPWSAPTGRSLHHLDWQTEQPVPLLKNVQRLTAPNPGVMTGPGTNSYLVGDPATGYIAIDPGPGDPSTWSGCGAPPGATSA